MSNRYVYLHVKGMTIHVKLDDEGVVVDAWEEEEVIASTYELYTDMGLMAPKELNE